MPSQIASATSRGIKVCKTVGARRFEPRVALYLLPDPASVGSTEAAKDVVARVGRSDRSALGTTQPIVEIGRTRISDSAGHDNARWSVAVPCIPAAGDQLVAAVRSLDRPWQRSFTTMQRADYQSPIDPQETLEFDGLSYSAWRASGSAMPCGSN
jgi:hypothetical protein